MDARTAAVVTVIALGFWHFRIRRHPGWSTPAPSSSTARFYFFLAYPAVVIAVFWLAQASSTSSWEWVAGTLWALTAVAFLIRGVDLMNHAAGAHLRTYPVHAQRIKLHR